MNARDAIATRALAELGTPFRLFGRTPGMAMDCVGLACAALGPAASIDLAQCSYGLRGDQLAKARSCLAKTGLREIGITTDYVAGDIVLASTGPSQLHFLINTTDGWVHADAGLGRVVLRPGPLPWPARAIWRLDGN